MPAPKLFVWFVFVAGDCTAAAKEAGYKAEYDPVLKETTVIVNAPTAESAQRIASHFGTVLDWTQIIEAKEA